MSSTHFALGVKRSIRYSWWSFWVRLRKRLASRIEGRNSHDVLADTVLRTGRRMIVQGNICSAKWEIHLWVPQDIENPHLPEGRYEVYIYDEVHDATECGYLGLTEYLRRICWHHRETYLTK